MHKAVTNGIFHRWDQRKVEVWFKGKFSNFDRMATFLDFIDRPENRAAAHVLRNIVDPKIRVSEISERLDRYKMKFDSDNPSRTSTSKLSKAFLYPSHMELGYDKSKNNSCRMLRQNRD